MKNISTKSMAPSPLLPLCLLLFLATAYGRTMKQAHFHNIINTTNSNDVFCRNAVEGLVALMKKFPALRLPYLSRDPCYPHKLIWIECNNDVVPRVTALYLGTQNLSGYLPDFSSMDALKRIYLQENSLYGPIPQFLGTFPQLTYLDLSNNHFSGALPDSLAINNNKIKLNLAGNSLQLPPPANTAVQFPLPIPTAKLIVPRLQLLFPPLAPNPPNPQFDFPPLAPNRRPNPPLAPNPPNPQIDFPPLAPNRRPNPPDLATNRPNPLFDFPPLDPNRRPNPGFPSRGSGGGGGGSFDKPQLGKTSKLPRILKFTLIPIGGISAVISAVLGTVCCCNRCRRKHNANAGAANSGVAEK